MIVNMSLKKKLLSCGIMMSVIPALVIVVLGYYQGQKVLRVAQEEANKLVISDIDHIVESFYSACQAQNELIGQQIESSLKVAEDVMLRVGMANLSDEIENWKIINQFTGDSQELSIPKLCLGQTFLGRNSSISVESPVVDKVQSMVSATCTIFQRVNGNDMLRVCTNVKNAQGCRAIGTYIPHINPDGQVNPVVDKLLKGETYTGRAFVVDRWYLTAYKPVLNDKSELIGALYVGIPQESVTAIRKIVMDLVVCQTGNAFVFDSKGNYIISKGGRSDGTNLWDIQDDNGNKYLQDMIKKAVAANGKVEGHKYVHKEGDGPARSKIARVIYYKPWDWVIGASSYEDEVNAAANKMVEINAAGNTLYGIVIIVSTVTSVIIWLVISTGITRKIMTIVASLSAGARQVTAASGQISSAAQALADGSVRQAAAMEETSSALEEIASASRMNADSASQTNSLAHESRNSVGRGIESMARMKSAISEIHSSADETARIIKVIDEIAFQTNLLALNAAVEAARAGEAGKGFAVVAEEVRNLAIRSADAARGTADLIDRAVKNSQNGVEISQEVGSMLEEISEHVNRTNELIAEIASSSKEQARGVDNINQSVVEVDRVTQQNASNAEESASASEELNSQAESLNSLVSDLVELVEGKK